MHLEEEDEEGDVDGETMRMMMIPMIWVIKSCKWCTPLRHLYCPWGADTGRPSRKDLDLDFQQPARRSYEWPGSAKLLRS